MHTHKHGLSETNTYILNRKVNTFVILTEKLSQRNQKGLRYCVIYFYSLCLYMTYRVIVAKLLSYKTTF